MVQKVFVNRSRAILCS